MAKAISFIDSEIGVDNHKIYDLGAVKDGNNIFHSSNISAFTEFIKDSEFLAGHNIVHHDLIYLMPHIKGKIDALPIDTLYLSPLLFPKKPYHALLKDDKLQVDELNNPVNDSLKAKSLFEDELNAFSVLPRRLRQIYCDLLYSLPEFTGFFEYLDYKPYGGALGSFVKLVSSKTSVSRLAASIREEFAGLICEHADLIHFIEEHPAELAYSLALVRVNDRYSITPPWLIKRYPFIDHIIKALCGTPCVEGCSYCNKKLNIYQGLNKYFGYKSFRTYNGEPLQEEAAKAALEGKSLLAVFPTGGGKSLTFQLPALMAGAASHGLTVVISPLQSLMKDQVDNLNSLGIFDAVTINGLLDPIERADAYNRVSNGSASLLYISPEQLRSRTIEKMLQSRNVVRFVIDEAHCFSAWGQDFRVDYLYIGDFIRELQKARHSDMPIPVSCFTATAKQKVISDIRDYFKQKLDLDLEIFATTAARENLHYSVMFRETEEEKYSTLRFLLEEKNCPTIIYVSRTKSTRKLAERLNSDGFAALPFNGKMDPEEKIENQEAFIENRAQIIVATSAFGMGVDKKDVKLVVHYDISDSLENYIQEAGRAGRDPGIQADCYVLYNNNDLDKHFILLNQTKLSIAEIQEVWKAIKDLTKQRPQICCSPLEIARQAGWDDTVQDIETRVKTAISALENAGYIKRGHNMPHVYASSILVHNIQEAAAKIQSSVRIEDSKKESAIRIIKSLISSRSIAMAGNDDAESRVDYLADILGMPKSQVIDCVNLMREDGILADELDMSAYIFEDNTKNKSSLTLERFAKLERYMLNRFLNNDCEFNLKELNGEVADAGIAGCNVKNIRTLLYYLTIKNYVRKEENMSSQDVRIYPLMSPELMLNKFERRIDISRFIIDELFSQADEISLSGEKRPVQFSLVGLYKAYCSSPHLELGSGKVTRLDVEDALLYLSKIGSMKIEGGFLVTYNGMEIKRLVLDNHIKYKLSDYALLNEFYKQKIRQIHIVGEFANLMVRNYEAALQFVQDYFQMDFKKFLAHYFKGKRINEIDRNITPDKYNRLFDELSDIQREIINDAESKYIVVAAGPGSGKTRVLVHKLASLLLMEDVKHEQLLMVTFSRAAATEFKKRLIELIGPAANYVDVKTFHSYCFDLLGKIGSLDEVKDVVHDAAAMIRNGEVEPGRIAKRVLVIDEAQDMDKNEYDLVQALMQANDDMRVIAVGDDDQNIYEFRGSNSKYLKSFVTDHGAKLYEMTENYRSKANIVAFSNAFVSGLKSRMKSQPSVSYCEENGHVSLIHHRCKNMESAIVKQVISNPHPGTTCILTTKNDEALRILGLLLQEKIPAKLIQSADGFQLYNLAEMRFFLKAIDRNLYTAVISDEVWEKAKNHLKTVYSDSVCLENCMRLIHDFEDIAPVKYRSDLEEFIRESNFEDFYDSKDGTIYISTIHKSKGHEFDNVYMLLNGTASETEEWKRALYVGMTRAKSNLCIHYNNNLFADFTVEGVQKSEDYTSYPEPEELAMQLGHRDVVLDRFKGKKKLIFKLRSGTPLQINGNYLSANIDGFSYNLVKFSHAFRDKLSTLRSLGYEPYRANVRFIVAWKGEDEEEETAIILPNLYLRKMNVPY